MAWTFDPSELRDFHGRWTGKGSGPIDHLAEMLKGSARGDVGHVGDVAVRRHGNRFSVAEPGKTPIKFGDARSAAAHALGASGLEAKAKAAVGPAGARATPEQMEMLRSMAVLHARKQRAGQEAWITSAELTGMTGRPGQVVGRILTGAADRGLVRRRGDRAATLTSAGLAEVRRSVEGVASAPAETHVGITPARGSGLTDAYYNTARYKGFENDLKREAGKAGVGVKITKVRGVWAGGGEPSARATFTGSREKVNAITDKIAGKYNQDATIAWRDRAGGPHVRYLSHSHVEAGRVERALANRERYGKIEGGTVTPDGRLEIYDLTGTEAQQQIAQLAGEIGTTFGYSQGDGELRFQGEHYPGPRFPAAG